jgi:hypothetical protein
MPSSAPSVHPSATYATFTRRTLDCRLLLPNLITPTHEAVHFFFACFSQHSTALPARQYPPPLFLPSLVALSVGALLGALPGQEGPRWHSQRHLIQPVPEGARWHLQHPLPEGAR